MRLGVHVRIAKGLRSAISEAERLGCETIQIFASNPNSWRESIPNPDAVDAFRAGVERLGLRPIILHTAYLLNLAAPNDSIYALSSEALFRALERVRLLGAQYAVTHIGSHGGQGREPGIARIRDAVISSLERSPGSHMVLLEGGAGAGNSIGSRFEEMAELLEITKDCSERIGIALDTAHLYGAGYDIAGSAEDALREFDRVVGLSRLHLFHLNDTRMALGSRRDRHWHIGEGNIGVNGFRTIVNHPALRDVAGILETPMDDPGWDVRNLTLLKSLRP